MDKLETESRWSSIGGSILVAVAMLWIAAGLPGCKIEDKREGKSQLVCSVDGRETFRSERAYYIAPRHRAEGWFIGDGVYMQKPGESCKPEQSP